MVAVLNRPPIEAAVRVSPMRAEGSFDVISGYVEAVLSDLGADGAIIDPTISMLEKPWYAEEPDDAVANQQMVIQAVSALPDSYATRKAIDTVTGVHTDPVVVAVTNLLQDIAKPPELSRQSQSGEIWTRDRRIAMMPHVLLAKVMVEQSALPTYYRGEPFRQLVADALGEHHGRQPDPSLSYGCGHLLGKHGRRVRDAVSSSDWFGAKFYRENWGNRDELGNPLRDEVRSQQFGAYLLYLFGGEDGYWSVSEKNNAWQVTLGVYEAMRSNHPSRLTDPEHVFNGNLRPMEQSHKYINLLTLNFGRSLSSLEALPLAS